jgi:hypothetical protein
MKGLQIPERFTGTIYMFVYSNPTSALYGMLSVQHYELYETDEKILLGSIDIDIPLDHTGSLDKQVEHLRASKRKIIDEASAKSGQIDEAIESLLAIEYKGDEQ